jgi:hypothetical protein
MFQYNPKGKPSFKVTNPQVSSTPLSFWDKLVMAPKNEWPQIVREFKLTPEQMIAAAERIKTVEERMNKIGVDLKSCSCNPYKFA